MYTKVVALTLFAALAAAPGFAQDHPDFSGTWKLNVAKSDFGVLPGPESRMDVIEQTGDTLKVTTTQQGQQGNQTFTINYTTDGKEATNKIGPREIRSTAVWEGSGLVVNSKLTFNDNDVTIKATWTLSADGKTLTISSHLASQMGETDQTLVFEKQEGGMPATSSVSGTKTTESSMKSTETTTKSGGTTTTTTSTTQANSATSTVSGPRPNFTGTWKLDPAKSDFGVLPGPESRTDTIEQGEQMVTITTDEVGQQGKNHYMIKLSTDGQENVNTVMGTEVKSTAAWDGPSLVSNSKLKFQDQDILLKSTMHLSEDGKNLILDVHLAGPMGETDQKLVYDRAP